MNGKTGLNVKSESGEVFVEATILVVIIIVAIFFTINIASLFFNRTTVVSVATEAAAAAGNVYNEPGRDPFLGYISSEYFDGRDVYRYWMKSDYDLNDSAAGTARWYSNYLLKKGEFDIKKKQGETDLDAFVTVECSKDSYLGATTVKVNVEKEYSLFIVNPMKLLGINPMYTCKGSGSAVCYDPIHQMNIMGLSDELTSKANGMIPASGEIQSVEEGGFAAAGQTMDLIDKVKSSIGKIVDIIEKVKNLF